jgi:transposase
MARSLRQLAAVPCEESCAGFYHAKLGRPSLPPGQYFRIMMIGFFEGLDSERGIAWRLADSLTLREFLSIGLDEKTPDHVTISRTRRRSTGKLTSECSPGCWSGWRKAG